MRNATTRLATVTALALVAAAPAAVLGQAQHPPPRQAQSDPPPTPAAPAPSAPDASTASTANGVTYFACIVPASGTMYRIRVAGTPPACTKSTHVEISWNQTGPAGVPCADGCVNNASLGAGAVTGDKVLGGHLVRSVNGLTDQVTLAAGTNVTITSTGQTLTISAAGGASGTSANTPNTLVQRDGTGGFAAGALTLSGKIDQASSDGFVARWAGGTGTIPASGAGTRLMWYAAKGAFRAGETGGTHWDDASVGVASTALGSNTTASGERSVAIGQTTTASGAMSTAFGYLTTASGNLSTAIGGENVASGGGSTALGVGNTAAGDYSTAMGNGTNALGRLSTAMGWGTTASGEASTAIGSYASTNGKAGAFVYGDASTSTDIVNATAPNQFVVRATGGFRLFTTVNTSGFTFEGGLGTGCAMAGGAWTCSGAIRAGSGGFVFPDGSVQETAASGGAGGTSENTPNTLVQRDATGGFAAGSVTTQGLVLNGSLVQRPTSGASGILSTGPFGSGGAAITEDGSWLMWNPAKAAFRAGRATTGHWGDAAIGLYSAAFGRNTTASGESSFATGADAAATKTGSVAIGLGALSDGDYAIAIGQNAQARGPYAIALGGAQATGNGAFAAGTSVASGNNSMAVGLSTAASGVGASALGRFTTASGVYSTAMGSRASTAEQAGSFVYGDASTESVVSATLSNQFLVRAAGGFRLRTAGDLASGCDLPAGSSIWDCGTAKLQSSPVSATAPSAAGQVLTWNGSAWEPAAPAAGTGTSANTPNTLVQRDASGGFAAGALTLFGRIDQTSVDGLVARGTYRSGSIPASGSGVRMMWYPAKGAFRAGSVEGTQWDESSIDDYSVAFGFNTTASGEASAAIGLGTVASSNSAIALGRETKATADYSTAMGHTTTADGDYSTTIGTDAAAGGWPGTFVFGDASGIFGQRTVVTATAANQFVARASGGFRLRTATDLGTGCNLPAGSSIWDCGVAKLQSSPVSATAPSAAGQVLTWNGSVWEPATPTSGVTDHGLLSGLTDDDHPQYFRTDGGRALTGPLNAGGNKVTNLAPATANGDAVPFEQAVKQGDAAGGDLAGNFPNPTVDGLQGRAVSSTAPANAQVLTWNGPSNTWAPSAVNTASIADGAVATAKIGDGQVTRAKLAADAMAPVAAAVVGFSGTCSWAKTANVSSCTYNATTGIYEITFSGFAYDNETYVAAVTALGSIAVMVVTTDTGGRLNVRTRNHLDQTQQSAFHFVVFKP